MYNAPARAALRHYSQVGIHSGVDFATPHRVIQMLMDGGLSRLAAAAGQMRRGERADQGESIGLAISIIGGLQASLDYERGGDLAVNLDRLYEYMTRTLVTAHSECDPEKIDHVHALLAELKAGWDAIPPDAGEADDADAAARR